MSEHILRPNAPAVVSEIIDGEVVIMNLATGRYFSAQGSACELWSQIEPGATERGLVAFLTSRYRLDVAEATRGVSAFVGQLREHGLVIQSTGSAGDANDAPAVVASHASYAEPTLNVYSDMEELLLLDPIHDVSEAGWPMPKPADS